MSAFREYVAPDSAKWRAERGEELCRAFGIEGDAMSISEQIMTLHRTLVGHADAWLVVRRRYALHPMVGVEDPEEMLAASVEEIAKAMTLKPSEVEDLEQQALALWKRRRASGVKAKEIGGEVREPLSEADRGRLLARYGFSDSLPADQKAFLGLRIQDLAVLLENENLRSAVRSMLQNELNLFFVLDATIQVVQAAIMRCDQGAPATYPEEQVRAYLKQMDHEKADHADRLQKLLKSRGDEQSKLLEAMKALGVSDLTTGLKRKLRIQDSLGQIVAAMQEYHRDGTRALIDGVFTELEVEVLVTDYDLRPAQYRPELAWLVPAAVERLFEPNYEPPTMPRLAHRRLRKAFRAALAAAREDDGGEQPEMLDESMREEAGEDEAL